MAVVWHFRKIKVRTQEQKQERDAKNKIDHFSKNWFATSWWLSIETLMEEIKPVVTEKYGFGYWDSCIFIALYGVSGLSRIW